MPAHLIGNRIRELRDRKGWSQQQLAETIPLSQRQLSRIENNQVHAIDRQTLIRIAESLQKPIATGELNQWLYMLGYRPHIRPLLPLPDEYQELVRYFMPYPATLTDIGWYARWWNRSMEQFYNVPNGSFKGIQANLFVQYFSPSGVMRQSYPTSHSGRVLSRLFWEWIPFEGEQWLQQLKLLIEEELGVTLEVLREQYGVTRIPPSPNLIFPISLRRPNQRPMRFRMVQIPIAHRPDLKITVYEPIGQRAIEWCRQVSDSVKAE